MSLLSALNLASILISLIIGVVLPLYVIHPEVTHLTPGALNIMISAVSLFQLYLARKENCPTRSFSFLIDVALLLPVPWVANRYFQFTHPEFFLLGMFSVRHVWRIKHFLDQFDQISPILYRLVPIFVTLPLLVHFVACTWVFLGS